MQQRQRCQERTAVPHVPRSYPPASKPHSCEVACEGLCVHHQTSLTRTVRDREDRWRSEQSKKVKEGGWSLSTLQCKHVPYKLFGACLVSPHSISSDTLPFQLSCEGHWGDICRPLREVNAFSMSGGISVIEQLLLHYQLYVCFKSHLLSPRLVSRSVVAQLELRGTEIWLLKMAVLLGLWTLRASVQNSIVSWK